MRAIGAGPAMTTSDGLIGVIGAVVVGSFIAATVAIALSPLAPIGPARRVYPSRGIAFDWTVLGSGIAAFVAVLSAVAIACAVRRAPTARPAARAHPLPRVGGRARRRNCRTLGRGRHRRALRGGVTARSRLRTRALRDPRHRDRDGGRDRHAHVRHEPADTRVAPRALRVELERRSADQVAVAATSRCRPRTRFSITTTTFPSGRASTSTRCVSTARPCRSSAGRRTPPVAPPLLSGHGWRRTIRSCSAATTLAALHKHLGDTVEASYGPSAATRLHIVGIATMPAVGPADQLHLSMGTGALVVVPRSFRPRSATAASGDGSDAFEPSAIFVRLRSGVDPASGADAPATARRGQERLDVSVVSVQRPAEIVELPIDGLHPGSARRSRSRSARCRHSRSRCMASVRRRRRDLALLKTLGFTRRQLAATVAWQSTIAVGIGVIIGVPLGIVAGRALWTAFAHELHVVPQPTRSRVDDPRSSPSVRSCSRTSIAALPGRAAARTPAALVLQSE